MIAAGTSKTGTIGFIGGMDIPFDPQIEGLRGRRSLRQSADQHHPELHWV